MNVESVSARADHAPASWRCPFFNPVAELCQAALTPRTPPRSIPVATCGSDAYEDCTTFLVGLLVRPATRTR